jgi:putative transposase
VAASSPSTFSTTLTDATCRKHGTSEATFYAWRSKPGGMEVSDVRKLMSLEDENARLKKLLAESMLDVSTLREMLAKNF